MRKSFLLQTFLWCIVVCFALTTFAQNKGSESLLTAEGSGSSTQIVREGINALLWDGFVLPQGTTGIVSGQWGGLPIGSNLVICADDFVIPSGETWTIDEIASTGFYTAGTSNAWGVQFWNDAGNSPNGGAAGPAVTVTVVPGDPNPAGMLSSPIVLSSGHYWVSIYGINNTATTLAAFRWNWYASEVGVIGVGSEPFLYDQANFFGGTGGVFASFSSLGIGQYANLMFQLYGTVSGGCPITPPSNPSPVSGAIDVPVSGNTLSWTNGTGTTMNEVYFNGNLVYDGAAITSYSLAAYEPLTYFTNYTWRIVCKDATCGTSGSTWNFTTMQDPLIVIVTDDFYPQNLNYWTGTCDLTTKTEVSLVNTGDPIYGWMAFDITAIPDNATITAVVFYGYVYATNWPYWSATPMVGVNPVTSTVAQIRAPIDAGWDSPVAYIFSNEASAFAPGWKNYPMINNANTDVQAALVQNWFSMGIIDRDFGFPQYFVNYEGWAQTNRPYLRITYEYVVPVELTSFAAAVVGTNVELNWSTATETNNQGFEVQRKAEDSEFEKLGYVAGFGTTTETKTYTYSDEKVSSGSYTYRLKQIDFDGSYEYSPEVEVDVTTPAEYALEQNYPNPFNPNTTIKYSIPVDGFVKLAVYNLLGEEVATLVNNIQKAGRYEVGFDGSDLPDGKAGLSSGVYIYRIETTNFASSKKLILLR